MTVDGIRDAWLGEDPLPPEPVPIVKRWLEEAFEDRSRESPHAVALATVDADGRPSVRMVLCDSIDPERGAFTFYTNRASRKGRALEHEPRAGMAFHWPGRQARVEGRVEWAADAVSDAYFARRPLEARLGAWASQQSEPVGSRAELVAAVEAAAERFGARHEQDIVPRPPHWGGIILVAESIELWVSRLGRIHDRALWRRDQPGEAWKITRLQP